MLIGIADEHLRPIVEAWQRLFGDEKVFFEIFPDAESIEAYLEDNALAVLFLRHDMKDVERILSLLQYLEAEKDSSAHAQIITICAVAPTKAAAQKLMDRLDAIGLYRVEYLPLVEEMFTCEPRGSIRRWSDAVPATADTDAEREYVIDPALWAVPRGATVSQDINAPEGSSTRWHQPGGHFIRHGIRKEFVDDPGWPNHRDTAPGTPGWQRWLAEETLGPEPIDQQVPEWPGTDFHFGGLEDVWLTPGCGEYPPRQFIRFWHDRPLGEILPGSDDSKIREFLDPPEQEQT